MYSWLSTCLHSRIEWLIHLQKTSPFFNWRAVIEKYVKDSLYKILLLTQLKRTLRCISSNANLWIINTSWKMLIWYLWITFLLVLHRLYFKIETLEKQLHNFCYILKSFTYKSMSLLVKNGLYHTLIYPSL